MIEKLATVGLSIADIQVLVFFLVIWCGYTWVADHSALSSQSISYAMDRQRFNWLREASLRDVKIVDTNVLSTLVTGISFFASSTVLVIGGLVAVLGYTHELAETFAHLPLVTALTAEALFVRFCLLLAIFIYAFFKFSWAFRTANYCGILIGGMADGRKVTPDENTRQERILAATSLSSTSGNNYNRGLRAYFFALASLGWFLGPILFAMATVLVLVVLIRREFASNSVRVLRNLK